MIDRRGRTARDGASGRRSGRWGRRRRRRRSAEPLGLAGIILGRPVIGVGVLEHDLARLRRARRARGDPRAGTCPRRGRRAARSARRTATNGRKAGPGQEPDPAGLEPARIVVSERGGAGGRAAGQEAAADQDLEAVADAQRSGRRGRGTAAGRRPEHGPSRVARIRPAPRSSP